ncbi:MAG: thioredoxin-disulfide reductase [Tissierellia bacterium]|jgi:thioredoxin reductase (NADPH)|nr:thioredoxin-disulfide reductase [Tissierellia bacterium]
MSKIYDLIIVGAGPAGLASALYAGRAKLDTLLLEKEKAGGQIVTTEEIENYPGSPQDESGPKLIGRMVEQVNHFGVDLRYEEVTGFDFSDKVKRVKTNKEEYLAKSIILANGAVPRKLDVPGEKEFTGRGVSYCATCDAAFYEDLEIYVIGGGDTAVEEAIYLTKFARKVYIVHRRDELRAAKSIRDKAMANEKIDFIWNSVVKEISGSAGVVDRMVLHNRVTGEDTEYLADEDDGIFGVFVLVGYLPETKTIKDTITLNDGGYIDADESLTTNVEGVFAAGDIRGKLLRQVVTATSDGAVAAIQAEKYIEENF